MKIIKKSLLKSGYYWEFKDFYSSIPNELSVPKYRMEVFTETITNKQILETYKIKPFSIEEAFAVATDYSEKIKKGEWKIIYFKDGTTTCRLDVYRHVDGDLDVNVYKVGPTNEWNAGGGVLFSNKDSQILSSATLGDLGSLSLKDAMKVVLDAGYVVYKKVTESDL